MFTGVLCPLNKKSYSFQLQGSYYLFIPIIFFKFDIFGRMGGFLTKFNDKRRDFSFNVAIPLLVQFLIYQIHKHMVCLQEDCI